MSDDHEELPVQRLPEVGSVRPSSLKHLVGQASVKAQVVVALEAAWADHRRFDHALLTGPPGVGKSTLASIIAAEMAADLHEVLGQSLRKPVDLHALLLTPKDGDVVHVDECHELPREQQTALYLAVDNRVLHLPGHGKRGPQALPLSDFTLLLSTTDEYRVLQPLRDRMRLNLRFDWYSPDELAEVVRQRVRALRWDVADAVLPLIAARARGTPRIALSLLQSAYRVCRAEGGSAVTEKHLLRACDLAQIDPLGLNMTERRYLILLAAAPNRLNVLASALGLPARTVGEVTEAYLIRSGLVAKDKDGLRALTADGREHLLREPPPTG